MRIGIFTNNYLPNPYGVSTSVEGFRRGLTALGHEVYIFAPRWSSDEKPREKVFRYPSIDLPTKVPFALPVPYDKHIDRIIKDLDLDIIHAQHPNLLGAQAHRWAIKKNIPLVFTWHSMYDRYAHYVTFVPERFVGQWAVRNALEFAQGADSVIVPTQSIYDVLEEKGLPTEKISIVPSGVDETFFANPDPQSLRKKFDIPDNQKVIVTVSRLTQEKNVLFLARAIKKILDDYRDAIVLFGGEGNLQHDLESYFADVGLAHRVIFPGVVRRSDMKHYLAVADLFVYASTSETQGTVITEAMYVGAPIVAVRASGVEDVIEDGVTGILVDEVTSDFAYVARRLLRDDDERIRIGKNAHVVAVQRYTVTKCTDQLLAVYEATLAKKKRE